MTKEKKIQCFEETTYENETLLNVMARIMEDNSDYLNAQREEGIPSYIYEILRFDDVGVNYSHHTHYQQYISDFVSDELLKVALDCWYFTTHHENECRNWPMKGQVVDFEDDSASSDYFERCKAVRGLDLFLKERLVIGESFNPYSILWPNEAALIKALEKTGELEFSQKKANGKYDVTLKKRNYCPHVIPNYQRHANYCNWSPGMGKEYYNDGKLISVRQLTIKEHVEALGFVVD